MSGSELDRAIANAKLLADTLARRETGSWTQPLRVETVFDVHGKGLGAAPRGDLGGGRAAVVCWDLGHNPAGRAMVLADLHLQRMAVDLVGPLWSRFGGELWSPIEDGGYSTVTFQCDRLADFVAKAYAVAGHRTYDVVHVCKPRLPGLILGSMLARASDCPIIVDIDDDELAFFPDADSIDPDRIDDTDLHEPTELHGTVLGNAIGASAAALTVSNVELQKRYGGVMVRHARDEHRFDPAAVSRPAGRDRLGAEDDDFVILFVGTPRPHKGLATVVEAMRMLDERYVLHVVGVADRARFERECDISGVRVVTHLPTDMAILPELLAAGDAIALMQDLDDPISDSQIPSKISDGLSMGVPVIVSDAPPMRDLVAHGLLRANTATELADRLRTLGEGEGETKEARTARRMAFLSEFSVGVNGARVEIARSLATAAATAGEDPIIGRAIEVASRAYLTERRAERADLFATSTADPQEGADLVFFWKQNDTGIYGRRSDMLAKHFAADPRVRRVLHFDAPLSTERASRDARLESADGTDHAPLLSRELLDRRLQAVDKDGVSHRTFLYSAEAEGADWSVRRQFDPVAGVPIDPIDEFADFVAHQMQELGMVPGRSIAWVCPVVPEFLAVHERLGFGSIVSDLIDDQRAFGHLPEVAAELDQQYRQLLASSEMVFTNCEPNAAAFTDYAADITVVPNGAEVAAFEPVWQGEPEAAPVVAYVGNMSDRIDWNLLSELAALRPDYRFVLVGSAHYSGGVHELIDRHDNVELRGVIPYGRLPEFFTTVDVGLVPHLAGPLTERMNPLKVYNYHAAGLPIVSTPIPNIDEIAGSVSIASDPMTFATAIDAAIAQRRAGAVRRDDELLESIDWATRAREILDRLEARGLLG